jgi:hypothetical protein
MRTLHDVFNIFSMITIWSAVAQSVLKGGRISILNVSQYRLSAPSARPSPRWWPQDRQSGWQHRLHLSGCHAWQFLMQIKRSQFISATIHSPSTPFVCLFVWIPNSPLPTVTLELEGASKCYIDPHPPAITRHVNLDGQLVEIAWTF